MFTGRPNDNKHGVCAYGKDTREKFYTLEE